MVNEIHFNYICIYRLNVMDLFKYNQLNNDKLEVLGWKHLKSEYDKSLAALIDLLKSKDDKFLDEEYYDTDFKDDYKYSFVINGMLHHDIYHLGQIGIIIKFLKKNNKS